MVYTFFMSDIQHQIEHWLEKGLISERTATKILSFEGLSTAALEQRQETHARGRMISVIAAFGGILLGVGVLIWVGTNWEELSVVTKLFIICAGLVLAHIGAFFAQEHNHPAVGRALALVGSIIFSSGLFLVAQMFHTNANPSLLFLIAAIGVAPVFIVKRDVWQGLLLIILLALWSGFYITQNNSPSPHYVALIPLVLLIGASWHIRSRIMVAFSIASAYVWYFTHMAVWQSNWFDSLRMERGAMPDEPYFLSLILLLIAGAGLISILGGHLMEHRLRDVQRGIGIIRPIGYLFLGGALFFASFNEMLFEFGGFAPLSQLSTPLIIVSIVNVLAIWVLLAALFITFRSNMRAWAVEGAICLVIVFAALVMVAAGNAVSEFARASLWEFHPLVLPWNILLLAYSIMLVCVGYFRNEQHMVNFGVVVFAAQVITRYADTFALRLGTATSFVVGGLLLIALALLLGRLRNRLLSQMKSHAHPL